jgi:hypothetical protein
LIPEEKNVSKLKQLLLAFGFGEDPRLENTAAAGFATRDR